tara:strand:- start:290 stop:427 length:138 start_codon:yes stop_codon:yes gene_type:complete
MNETQIDSNAKSRSRPIEGLLFSCENDELPCYYTDAKHDNQQMQV